MESGEQCVMTSLTKLMLTLFADSWATTMQAALTISQCKITRHDLSSTHYTCITSIKNCCFCIL